LQSGPSGLARTADSFEPRDDLDLVADDDAADVEVLIPAQPKLPTVKPRRSEWPGLARVQRRWRADLLRGPHQRRSTGTGASRS
jgi:hypothetical protein